MDESEDFATLFARSEAGPTLERGQAVKGRVIQITSDHVFVDVGGKGEAWIDRAELTDDDGKLRVAVGDEVEATVVGTGDEIRLSHKLRRGAQAREALEMAAQSGITVEGERGRRHQGGLRGHARRPARVLSVLADGSPPRGIRAGVRGPRAGVPCHQVRRKRPEHRAFPGD